MPIVHVIARRLVDRSALLDGLRLAGGGGASIGRSRDFR
jgi:hypothetical protein